MLSRLASTLVLLQLAGCILETPGDGIGTWPTPEMRGRDPVGIEACDGYDDDADGSVDEGCACGDAVARGCVAITDDGNRCGFGVQWCERGEWRECDDAGPPFTPVRAPSLELVSVSPPAVVRGDAAEVTVVARPQAACDAIAVKQVEVSLEATTPNMRVLATARDTGELGDAEAGDGEFTAVLPNAFGPGVPAQTLTVRARASIGNEAFAATHDVELEEP